MQDLGAQAAHRVLAASEPLKTLRDICQNFPFQARSLSKLPVNRELASEVQHLQQTMYGEGFSGLFLNGLPLPILENVSNAAMTHPPLPPQQTKESFAVHQCLCSLPLRTGVRRACCPLRWCMVHSGLFRFAADDPARDAHR